MKRLLLGLVALVVVCLTAGRARADLTYGPSAAIEDAVIYSESSTRNGGAAQHLLTGRIGPDTVNVDSCETAGGLGGYICGATRRSFIRFNLGSIPTGSTIVTASVTLYLTLGSGELANTLRPTSLHRVTQSWVEGTGAGASQGVSAIGSDSGDGVTWTYRNQATLLGWSCSGGCANAASATVNVSNTLSLAPPDAYVWSGSGMVADVQAWVNSPSTNFGWQIRGDESTTTTNRRFHSSFEVTYYPRLTVTYKLPLGQSCGFASDCASNFCTNGVCCFTSSCGAAGECQLSAPVCLGASCSNPAKPNGTLCTADSNLCSQDVCTSGACTHNLPASSSTVCRASGGICDITENCNGSTTICPPNAFQSGTVCRAVTGGCDVAETCNGSSATCPVDGFALAGAQCRATAGACDVAETCPGGTPSCPADVFLSSATPCRGSAGVCDVAENCTGGSATCPANTFASSATVCRASGGVCDIAENCTGGSATCPANTFVSSATLCRASGGVCDVAENCTGGAASCPVDGFASSATVCRASGGVCDVADNCTGSGATCPSDAKQSAGTGCNPDTNDCTLDRCDGVGNACTHPAGNAGTQCRPPTCTAGIATLPEVCDGSSTVCPGPNTVDCAPNSCGLTTCSGGCTVDTDCASTAFCSGGICQPKKANGLSCGGNNHCTSTFCVDGVCCENTCAGGTTDCQACNNATQLGLCRPRANGAVCRVAAGECDQDDTCNGTSTTCTDVKKTNGTGCTPDSNDCTNDTCNGASNLCQHPFKPALAACTTDNNPCTVDQCDGAGLCMHPAGNAGAQCRVANGEPCDVADSCDGVSTGCADNKRAVGFACTDDGSECTNDQCDGTNDLCQHPDKPLDTPCSTDNNACTRDVCNAGACTHPAGNAGAVCRSSGGVCDVQETCTGSSTACPANAFQPSTLQCRAASCSTGIATFAANCTGSTATCPAISTQACTPFICSGTACSTTCASDSGCATTAWCNGNACDPKESDGAPCTAANQCLSSQCVDGVCCNRACAGQCEACDVGGTVGRCTNVIGDPHGSRPACAGDGTACAGFCNGTLNTACFLPATSTQCRAPSCSNGVATVEAFCVGTGSCPAVTTQDCGQFVCDVSGCFGNCTADIQCVATSYCSSGVCVPKLGLGTTCNTDNQCTSARCVDGVCCNDRCLGQCEACNVSGSLGTCTAVSGTPHAPRLPCVTDGSLCGGACDGTVRTSCTYPGAGTSCRSASCSNDQAVLEAFCDGAGSCPAEFRQSCAPFACAGTTCAGDCASNRDCSSTEFCSANVCAPKRNNGETCPDGNACKSGICIDGMCCDSPCTAQCEACDVTGSLGTCVAVVGAPHGTRPACTTDSSACGGTCNGSLRTACGYPAAETSCRAASCAVNVATMAATCNGSGRCPAPQQISCGTLGCSGTRCGGNCTTDANCATDQFCLAGICTPLLIIGQPCSSGAQCLTTFCVDGVCCDRACTGQCEACDIVTRPGLCTAVTSGLPHGGRASCAGVGPCAAQCTDDSATQCTFPNSSTVCGGGACLGQAAIEPPLCNGAGSCLAPTTRVCNPYVCSGSACLTTCSADSDCVTGYVCSSASCVPAPPDAGSEGGVDAGADAGDASAAGSGGTGTGATGGTGASGGSGGSGASAAAAGSDADAGDAGPKPPGASVEDDGGCGCRVANPERDGTRGLALIAGIALLAAARRRRAAHSR